MKGVRYYWDDDKQWKKIVDGIATSSIATTRISITPEMHDGVVDTQDLDALFGFIQQSGLGFGILDVSNTPTFCKKSALNLEWAAFLQSAAVKPTRVLLTDQPALFFKYFNYSFDDFLTHLKLPRGIT